MKIDLTAEPMCSEVIFNKKMWHWLRPCILMGVTMILTLAMWMTPESNRATVLDVTLICYMTTLTFFVITFAYEPYASVSSAKSTEAYALSASTPIIRQYLTKVAKQRRLLTKVEYGAIQKKCRLNHV